MTSLSEDKQAEIIEDFNSTSIPDHFVSSKMYDKHDDFDFDIVILNA